MQASKLKNDGFTYDPDVLDYLAELEICEHYRVPWTERDQLSQDDVDKARLYFEAKSEAYREYKAARET